MTDWVCSSCGGRSTKASAARPSLDDRYAVGYCAKCAPEPEPVKIVDTARNSTEIQAKKIKVVTVPLVRADLWDPAVLVLRAQREEELEFLEKVRTGRIVTKGKHAQAIANTERVRELTAKYEAERVARHAGVHG